MANFWSGDDDNLLRSLFGNLSMREIGECMGRSKNSVLSRATRIGLTSKGEPKPPVEEHNRAATNSKPNTAPRRVALVWTRATGVLPPRAFPAERKKKHVVVPLIELTSDACRWPHGHVGMPGFGFCGQKRISGGPYCVRHHAMAHQSKIANGTRIARSGRTVVR